MPAAAAAPDPTEASCRSPIRTAANGTPGSSPRESTSHTQRSRAISSANIRRKRRSPRSMLTRRVSRRPTGSRSWSGTTSSSDSPTLRSSGSTARSQSARPTARRRDWWHWPRSTSTSRGAKPSPRTSTRRTATSNSQPASMPTPRATHPTSQNAITRRAKPRDSTSICNTTDNRGNMRVMTADPLDSSAGVPYDVLAELRDACPVSRTPSGAYFLARHDDVLAATKNIDAFQASFRSAGVVVPPEEQLISEIPEPRHGKIRRIINSAIAQHRISRVEPFIRALCHALLDSIVERGGGDLVADYVTPIPATVIAHLLGVDPADHARFAEWSDIVVQSTYATKNRREDGADGEGLAGVAPH